MYSIKILKIFFKLFYKNTPNLFLIKNKFFFEINLIFVNFFIFPNENFNLFVKYKRIECMSLCPERMFLFSFLFFFFF